MNLPRATNLSEQDLALQIQENQGVALKMFIPSIDEESQEGLASQAPQQPQKDNYSDFVTQGYYHLHQGGLWGKHDNVRRLWEDQLRIRILRPHLQQMANHRKKQRTKLRIADLGAGTGQGLELLTMCLSDTDDLADNNTELSTCDMIDSYMGCDLCPEMVSQGNAIYADCDNIVFCKGDLSKGFPLKDEEPFNLYYSSYASLSHINDDAMTQLLTEIVQHVDGSALLVGDWLGRLSIEWPCYWQVPDNTMSDYSMNWLDNNSDCHSEPGFFPMCFWNGEGIRCLIDRVTGRTGAKLELIELHDISVFVGRHVDTSLYNESVKPLRSLINCLHESNYRTDIDRLRMEMPFLNSLEGSHEDLYHQQFCWNKLVEFCRMYMETHRWPPRMKDYDSCPAVLRRAMLTIKHVIDMAVTLQMDDPRANIIEPQLGYALRDLEHQLQTGKGRGHGLVAVIRITKD